MEWWPIGWKVSDLASALPALDSAPDMLVDAQSLAGDQILGLYVSVIGDEAQSRETISGFPVFARHRFGTAVCVEIEAFTVPPENEPVGWPRAEFGPGPTPQLPARGRIPLFRPLCLKTTIASSPSSLRPLSCVSLRHRAWLLQRQPIRFFPVGQGSVGLRV